MDPNQSPGADAKTTCVIDDGRAKDLMFWFPEAEDEPPTKRRGAADSPAVPITSRPRILFTHRDTALGISAPFIDAQKYSPIVTTIGVIFAVCWKQTDQTPELRKKFNNAKKFPDPARQKRLVASCSSPLTLYTVGRIRRRIERWRTWHASWVYDGRPSS